MGKTTQASAVQKPSIQGLVKYVPHEEIPASEDLLLAPALEKLLTENDGPPLSLIATGDIMLGGRSKRIIADHGVDYPLAAVLPLLRRAPIVLGNLEGPFARRAKKEYRIYSYRVNPQLAVALARAGFTVVTLANNH